MRVTDLRLKDKEINVIEGNISSIKTTKSDGKNHIGIVLDTGYLVQISLDELSSVVDYSDKFGDTSEKNSPVDQAVAEEVKQENKGINVTRDVQLGGYCSICGSPYVWFSKDLGIQHCSNGKCKNSNVSVPNFDS
jgi:hypothetical protein